jgi:hypothetical protein
METIVNIFGEKQTELTEADFQKWLSERKFKQYGTKNDGVIFYIDEDRLNQAYINQIRNYLDSREKLLKARK